MKRFLLFLPLFLLTACAVDTMAPVAEGGTMDLTRWNFANGPAHLDGEWTFYWAQLLTPQDLAANAPQPTGMLPAPASWNTLTSNGERMPSDGAVTMRLQVTTPGSGEYALFVPSYNTAYRVWVNGQEVAASGVVGRDAASDEPAGFGQVARFYLTEPMADIVVQASAFEGVPGGPIARFVFGARQVVETYDNRQIATDFFVAGACAVIGLIYLSLYLLRRKETAFLWFALFCLIIAARTTLVGREVVHLLWPNLNWELSLKSIFVAGALSAVSFAAFITSLYRAESWAWVTPAAWGLGLLTSVAILLSPPAALFSPAGILFNGVSILAIAYSAIVVIRAVSRQRPGAALLMLSTLPLGLAILLEALGSARLIPIISVAGFGVLATIIAQTFTILRNFTLAFAAVESLSERLDRTNKAYYRFVPREFLRLVGRDDIVSVELGDQAERVMTILFCDVRGFTGISETMTPEENFTFINMLLSSLSPVIREHNGFIDKYLGDGIMALFPDKAEDGVRAAIAIRRALTVFNAERTRNSEPSIRLGIGLHTGSLMLGTVGEPERMDGTVIADAVNTASRLESLTKRYSVVAIASAETIKAMDNWGAFGVRTLGSIRAKGKKDTVALYELFDGDADEVAKLKRSTLVDFEQGVNRFQEGKFGEAAVLFKHVLQLNPVDATAAYYSTQCAYFETAGVPADWDGVETALEK